MSFKKDRKYDYKQKIKRKAKNLLKRLATENLKVKFANLKDDETYNLKDFGFKENQYLTGKQIKSYFE